MLNLENLSKDIKYLTTEEAFKDLIQEAILISKLNRLLSDCGSCANYSIVVLFKDFTDRDYEKHYIRYGLLQDFDSKEAQHIMSSIKFVNNRYQLLGLKYPYIYVTRKFINNETPQDYMLRLDTQTRWEAIFNGRFRKLQTSLDYANHIILGDPSKP